MKRGVEFTTEALIPLVLVIIFATLVVAYYTGAGQKITESINENVLSKLPKLGIELPKFGQPEQKGLTAVITITPGPPACHHEELELSALNSKLVTGNPIDTFMHYLGLGNIVCSWDLDTSDKIIEDSTDCVVHTTNVTAKTSTNVKLKLKIVGPVSNSGATATATANITTESLCACDSSPCYPLQNIAGTIVKDGDVTKLILSKDSQISSVHIYVKNLATTEEQKLNLVVGTDVTSAYILKEKFLDYYWVEDQNLAKRITANLVLCQTATCEIPLTWYTDNKLQILGVYMPYGPKAL